MTADGKRRPTPRRAPLLRLGACLLAALLATPGGAQEIDNSDLFLKSQKAAMKALEYYGRYDNQEELDRIADIGYRLAQESTFRKYPLTFYLVDMPEPNAFALPGGQIFLTHGMLELGLTDDMLAGLLGHEIGHVVLEHGLRMQKRATLLNVVSQALLVGVLINASQQNRRPGGVPDQYGRTDSGGDLIQGTAAAGAVVSELLMRSYSREFEDESDDEGQRLAAAAGFDPDGTRQLMDAMRSRMPQSRDYGYWRTHPFFEERVKAAGVRRGRLKIQEPKSADAFRAKTQTALLGALDGSKPATEVADLVKEAALLAWPQGAAADDLRLERLTHLRDEEMAQPTLAQDYGALIQTYTDHLQEVRRLTPESPLVAKLEAEIADFITRRSEAYPQAVKVLDAGVFETDFLETFLSNYPTAAEAPRAALLLGDAYSRLSRQSEAIERYLQAMEGGEDDPASRRAREGLRSLTPYLQQLAALQQLASREEDAELQELASKRLEKMATEYKDLANGAAYLRKYPDGPQAEAVARRLNTLADQLFGEVVLYQTVGDTVKGIERISQILTYAPDSPAAARLRERMVLEG